MVKAKTSTATKTSALVLSILMLLSCFSVLTGITAKAAGDVKLLSDYSHGFKSLWFSTKKEADTLSASHCIAASWKRD